MSKDDQIQEIIELTGRMQRPTDPTIFKTIGLSSAQSGLLFMLHYHPGISIKEMSAHLGISKSAIAQLLDGLIDKQLVARAVKPEDKRVAVLSVTDAGKHKLKQLRQLKVADMRAALAGLSSTELEQLSGIYQKLSSQLKISKV